MPSIPVIKVGDTIEMKKPHPCGNRLFKVMRTGSDIKIVCIQCSRSLTLERIKLEKSIKKIIPSGKEEL